MKTIVALSFLLLVGALRAASPVLEEHRTDINPALLYLQAMAFVPEISKEDQSIF